MTRLTHCSLPVSLSASRPRAPGVRGVRVTCVPGLAHTPRARPGQRPDSAWGVEVELELAKAESESLLSCTAAHFPGGGPGIMDVTGGRR